MNSLLYLLWWNKHNSSTLTPANLPTSPFTNSITVDFSDLFQEGFSNSGDYSQKIIPSSIKDKSLNLLSEAILFTPNPKDLLIYSIKYTSQLDILYYSKIILLGGITLGLGITILKLYSWGVNFYRLLGFIPDLSEFIPNLSGTIETITRAHSSYINRLCDFIFGPVEDNSSDSESEPESNTSSDEEQALIVFDPNNTAVSYITDPRLSLNFVERIRGNMFGDIFFPYLNEGGYLEQIYRSVINTRESAQINLQNSHYIPNLIREIDSSGNTVSLLMNLGEIPQALNNTNRPNLNFNDLIMIVRQSDQINYAHPAHSFFSNIMANSYTQNVFNTIPWEVLNYQALLEASLLASLNLNRGLSLVQNLNNHITAINNVPVSELVVSRMANQYGLFIFNNWVNTQLNNNFNPINPSMYSSYFNNLQNRLPVIVDRIGEDSFDSGVFMSEPAAPLAGLNNHLETIYENIIPITVRLLDFYLYHF